MHSWDDYRYFLAAAQSGSLSAAARRLRTNQSTVGRRIAVLEKALGIGLFRRHARGLSLTEAGERILQAVESMEEGALAVERIITGKERQPTGTVRLSAPEILSVMLLASRLNDLHQEYPGIEVVLEATDATADLTRGEADLALRMYRSTALDLVVRRIGSLSFGLYAAIEYLERRGAPQTQAELAGHDLITYSDSGAHLANAQWCAEQLSGMITVLRTRSILVRAQAAANGLGITLLPCIVGKRWSRLTPVLDPSPLVTTPDGCG